MKGGWAGAGERHLLDAEVVLLELDTARARAVPAALDLRHTAKVASTEKVLLERPPPDSLDILGAHQLPLLRLHTALRSRLAGGVVPVEFPGIGDKFIAHRKHISN